MAFKVKKRQPMVDSGDQTDTNTTVPSIENTENGTSNVVATQSWVYRKLGFLWNWTKFFATEAMRVAGPLHAQRIKTSEIQADEAYAQRLVLLDREGRPGVVYIGDDGKLHLEYDFKNVYMYNQDGIEVKKFVYSKPEIVDNFIGLTPYETFLNFIPFDSNEKVEFQGRNCSKLCAADGKDALVEHTLLVRCSQVKKIVGLKVLDESGETIQDIDFPEMDRPLHQITINMPCFRYGENLENVGYVGLTASDKVQGHCSLVPFMPPFLKPPHCPGCSPFVEPLFPPPLPAPCCCSPDMQDDIFDEDQVGDSDIFSDTYCNNDEENLDKNMQYEVSNENYSTNTYYNVTLKRSDFNQNQEQYLVVKLEDI